ncbi:hypothetical protein HN873_012006 [Arachis hypogaea]
MAFELSFRRWILAFALFYVCLFWKLGNADYGDDQPGNQIGSGFGGAGVGIGGNPAGAGVGGGGSGGGFGGGGGGGGGGGAGGGGFGDPTQIVSKALLCFNDKYIYTTCEESYRLSERGDLNVPSEKTDEFCEGPCLTETNLVLSCLDNIFSHFIFYNKATIQDIKQTIQSACGYGPQRGDFNVAEHIQAEGNRGLKGTKTSNVLMGLALILMGPALLL